MGTARYMISADADTGSKNFKLNGDYHYHHHHRYYYH
jgi:hypothetical protein